MAENTWVFMGSMFTLLLGALITMVFWGPPWVGSCLVRRLYRLRLKLLLGDSLGDEELDEVMNEVDAWCSKNFRWKKHMFFVNGLGWQFLVQEILVD